MAKSTNTVRPSDVGLDPASWPFQKALKSFSDGHPNLAQFLSHPNSGFRGLSVIISDRGGYLLVLKRFSDDGTPEVSFSNGHSPYLALLGAEYVLDNGSFRVDKSR